MKRSLVLTMGDATYRPLTDLTFPSVETYAGSIGADFHVISSRTIPNVHMGYEKFQARGLLDRYERIIYLDGDVLVRPGTPNLLDLVPYGSFGAVNELDYLNHWTEEMVARQIAPCGWEGAWSWGQFNSGVMIFDDTHKKVFENPVVTNLPLWDQPCLNVAVRRLAVPFFNLPVAYNFMVYHRYSHYSELRRQAHILHFSGVELSRRVRGLKEELGLRDGCAGFL